MLLAASPASAQFVCTTTASDISCNNAGTQNTSFQNKAIGTNQNADTTNTGTASGFQSLTTGGGNATATNNGTNTTGVGVEAITTNGGNATATNNSTNTNGVVATAANGGNAIGTNAGTNTGGIAVLTNNGGNATATNTGSNDGISATTLSGGDATVNNSSINSGGIAANATGGNATVSNSGSNTLGIAATATGGNATVSNSGSNTLGIAAKATSGDATVSNSGSNTGDISAITINGGNAAATNSGSNTSEISATAINGGSATAVNSGSNTGIIVAQATTGNATATNSGSNTGAVAALTSVGDATATNSGNNAGGIVAATIIGNATASNSGSNTGGIVVQVTTGSATATNSGSNVGGISAQTNSGNATVINSGSTTNTGGFALIAVANGNATVINSGVANGGILINGNGLGALTLTNVVGGRVIGPISLGDTPNNIVNFQGGNWLFAIGTVGNTTINTGGAPFVSVPFGGGGMNVAVLDPTTFALADRALTNFTGEISEMLQGRFGAMSFAGGEGGGGPGALGFAAASGSPAGDRAQAAFSGIPSVAMSYASGAHPVLGKAPAAGVPYYDTTVWASGFGGERKQRADGDILPTTDTAFGGAMGVDRIVNSNLRLGAFVGAGSGREAVELNVQTIDATYVFGGGYGRFDWTTQYLDFALYGGGIDNKSTRQIANNTAPNGLESATARYGGWFISPEVTYGYRIPFNAVTVTPRLRLRYVGGALDGYSESGSGQNLSVGRRAINDLEERGEVELSTASGPLKASATIGVVGLERLGNPTINTVLLGQNLSFVTPGQASAVGGVLGLRMEYRARSNVALFVAGEGTAMSDRSDSFAATGGARVSF